MPPLKNRKIDDSFIKELSIELMGRASNRQGGAQVIREMRGRRPFEVAQVLLGRVYQVSWLLLGEA